MATIKTEKSLDSGLIIFGFSPRYFLFLSLALFILFVIMFISISISLPVIVFIPFSAVYMIGVISYIIKQSNKYGKKGHLKQRLSSKLRFYLTHKEFYK